MRAASHAHVCLHKERESAEHGNEDEEKRRKGAEMDVGGIERMHKHKDKRYKGAKTDGGARDG